MTRAQENQAKLVNAIAMMALISWLVRPGNDTVKRVIMDASERIEKRTGTKI